MMKKIRFRWCEPPTHHTLFINVCYVLCDSCCYGSNSTWRTHVFLLETKSLSKWCVQRRKKLIWKNTHHC